MARSIGVPVPDCSLRSSSSATRRQSVGTLAAGRGRAHTISNGEEVDFGGGYLASYHKGLPHDALGRVLDSAYGAMVTALMAGDGGAIETLPLGANRRGAGTPDDPARHSEAAGGASLKPLTYRKMTSPLTGHVYDTQGADAGELAIGAAPAVGSHELSAEIAELYAMALLRDVPFTRIASGTGDAAGGLTVAEVIDALKSMPFLAGGVTGKLAPGARRRFETRGVIATGAQLFRGSTEGSKAGPWLSQFMLVGNDTTGFNFDSSASPGGGQPNFPGISAKFEHQDGFLIYGTQIIDQRSVVADERVDWLTNYAAWLDAQNGVDFNGFDILKRRRRFLTTPRDVATYVHYDALYQAYLNACLLMVGPVAEKDAFPRDRGMPETRSRTRSAFASFGGPHVLSLVTEVATRALKAVWRQKWQYHRRLRPEVLGGLLTLQANSPAEVKDAAGNITNADDLLIADDNLRERLDAMLSGDVSKGAIPTKLLQGIAQHNELQNAASRPRFDPLGGTGLPSIDPSKNFLLPQAFPEGSPTHPAYGAGHATVAGACVTALKAFFEMFDDDDCTPRKWRLPVYVPRFQPSGTGANAGEGGELEALNPKPELTVQGELDKLAMNIANARNMAGVHYYTDYYESLRLGERVTVSILEEQMSLYPESVSMHFTSFDGDDIRIVANGDGGRVLVHDAEGKPIAADAWFQRYGG